MIKEIHFILTYKCNFECDHCFLYCSPRSDGTFTIKQISRVLEEAKKIGTIEWIFYEGGEPFLFFPLMIEGIRRAGRMGLKVGAVTNAYGAASPEDAELWLKPLAEAGLSFLNISNDSFHYGDKKENPASIAYSAAVKLGIESKPIYIENPKATGSTECEVEKGRSVAGGSARFRGRAVDKLIKDLPLRSWNSLNTCPYEDLTSPSRVHIDSYGNIHLCQGLIMGNLWERSLSEIISNYQAELHPICGPLVRGGPAQLAKELNLIHEDKYVDECHFCYLLRHSIINDYPEYLAPKQVYGFE